jgi:hypothetical protein
MCPKHGVRSHRTKVQYTAFGNARKTSFDYVTRRLNALPTGLKKRSGGLTSLRHRLARSPDPARASSLAQRGGRFTGLVAMAPGSCVDLEQSTLNKKAVYEIRQRYQTNLRPSPNPHLHRAPATDSPPATADTGCLFSSPSVPLNAYQATSRHYRSNDLALWAMVRGRNVSGAAAKLPLLRHAKAAAAMERAHPT